MGGRCKNGVSIKIQWFACELQQTQPCCQYDETEVLGFFSLCNSLTCAHACTNLCMHMHTFFIYSTVPFLDKSN